MSKPTRRPRSAHRRRAPRAPAPRVLAALLCLLLAFAAVSPALAAAGEIDSEGEGTAAPGPIPGLEEGPDFEPGGEEAELEEVASLPGEEGEPGEEVEEEELPPGAVTESPPAEAPPVPETTAPPAPEAEVPTPEPAPPAEAPRAAETPPASASSPTYEPEPGPIYEAAPPLAAPVRGEAIVASPPAHEGPRPSHGEESAAPAVVEAPQPAPAEAPEAPEAEPAPPAATPPEHDVAAPGSLTGHRSHTVAPGECLWSIAEALLRPGASDARIAAEVHRLWHLNAARIGTGDPNMILVGTELLLR